METQAFDHRFNRLEGQLKRLQQNIQEGKDCTDIIPQFLAVKGALHSAFISYMHHALEECEQTDPEKMKSLLALLIKHQ